MIDSGKKCAHASCECTTSSESGYCSPHCEITAETNETPCECKHAQCNHSYRNSQSKQSRTSSKKVTVGRSREAEERERALDQTLADSYPASDPLSTDPNPSGEN